MASPGGRYGIFSFSKIHVKQLAWWGEGKEERWFQDFISRKCRSVWCQGLNGFEIGQGQQDLQVKPLTACRRQRISKPRCDKETIPTWPRPRWWWEQPPSNLRSHYMVIAIHLQAKWHTHQSRDTSGEDNQGRKGVLLIPFICVNTIMYTCFIKCLSQSFCLSHLRGNIWTQLGFRCAGLHYCIGLIKCIVDSIREILHLDISILLNEIIPW